MNKNNEENLELKIIDNLLGFLQHDLKTILQVFKSGIQIFEIKNLIPDSEKDILDSIKSRYEQLEKILHLMTGYSKKKDYIDIEKTFDRVISLSLEIKGRKITIKNDCKGLKIFANESFLVHLLYNLFYNSIKYAGTKFSLTRLYFKEKRDRCSLIYTDNGVGIVNEEKKKIFEEGYGEGTGQGLYLIKEISTMYGWEVMEAGTYGKGAKFVILIPKYNEEGIENYKIE